MSYFSSRTLRSVAEISVDAKNKTFEPAAHFASYILFDSMLSIIKRKYNALALSLTGMTVSCFLSLPPIEKMCSEIRRAQNPHDLQLKRF